MSESRVTWATSVSILVFLGLSVLELGPMYDTDRQTSDRQMSDKSIAYGGGGIIMAKSSVMTSGLNLLSYL